MSHFETLNSKEHLEKNGELEKKIKELNKSPEEKERFARLFLKNLKDLKEGFLTAENREEQKFDKGKEQDFSIEKEKNHESLLEKYIRKLLNGEVKPVSDGSEENEKKGKSRKVERIEDFNLESSDVLV